MDYFDDLSDSRGGWIRYRNRLRLKNTDDPKEIESLDRSMCKGWCIGSGAFRKSIAKKVTGRPELIRLDREELSRINREKWQEILDKCLLRLGRTQAEARKAKYSQDWKLAVALILRRRASVSNAWLTDQLSMGTPRSVSAICGKYERERAKDCGHFAKLTKLTFDT